MKTRYKIIGTIGIIAVMAFILMPAQAEIIGNKYCYQGWLIPGVLPLYICNNEDGSMDHSFLTYDAMVNYYVPPLEQVEPPYTFVEGGSTETLSGQ